LDLTNVIGDRLLTHRESRISWYQILPGGFMDIIRALKREEAKLEKNVKHALKQLAALKATMKFSGGTIPGTKLAYGKKRRMSAAGRLAISKATKARWAKVRAAKAEPRRKMSAAGRASIVKAQKARWAKVRAAKAKAA
jgi:hypothetical protein